MRPVIEKNRFGLRHVFYIIIITICIVAIGIGVYMQFFKDEKLGVIFGITKEKEDQELKELQENFFNSFTNDLEIINNYSGSVKKIKNEEDIVILAFNKQEQKENYTMDIKIPYFNIKAENAINLNQKIKNVFKNKADSVASSTSDVNIIYNVKYKAYLNKSVLSLVILSELKEGDSNQRIIVMTYNYNLENDSEVTINDIIKDKNLDTKQANEYIKNTVDNSQDENLKLRDLGYPIDVRDSNSKEYKIENAKYFFLGTNGYLYVVYPYGNKELTSEMDFVIIR